MMQNHVGNMHSAIPTNGWTASSISVLDFEGSVLNTGKPYLHIDHQAPSLMHL